MELFKYPLDLGFAGSVNLRKEQPEWYVLCLLSNAGCYTCVDNVYPSMSVVEENSLAFWNNSI